MPHLIVLSHLRWGFVYQRPQHLLSRLSRHYPVIFVEEPIQCDGPPHLESRSEGPDIEVLTPRTPVSAPGFHDDQLAVIEPLLRGYLADHAIADQVAWFYTPMALPLLEALLPRAVIYDCMDELAAFKHAPLQLRQRETALLKIADVVLTGGPALYEAKKPLHPNVHCLPSAVDAAHFSPQRSSDACDDRKAALDLQSAIASPRLGFFGVIDERLDIGLLEAIADARPQWQLVMVGPVVKIDAASLPRRANIHWLGMQSYDRLPHLAASWDVCLLPFALNDSTRFISPTKTLEYMAAGKPIVSTGLRDVRLLYGEVVRIAEDATAFVDACEAALAEPQAQRAERRRRMKATVARYSWDSTAETVRRLIAQECGSRAPHAASHAVSAAAPAGAPQAPSGAQAPGPEFARFGT